ncbi:MAG: hypothetical protein E7175_04400 [Erysipelotrichaceae bacterium]|jgi:hypothetical protein|nr:hypothetical protein [Erysipelotrichaceae bacterium]
MNFVTLSEQELSEITVGEAITLSAVLAVVAVAVVAVVVYKLFLSKKGTASLGGWKFSWN